MSKRQWSTGSKWTRKSLRSMQRHVMASDDSVRRGKVETTVIAFLVLGPQFPGEDRYRRNSTASKDCREPVAVAVAVRCVIRYGSISLAREAARGLYRPLRRPIEQVHLTRARYVLLSRLSTP